jgi:23S rRNA (uridine2552-2'-O)-methyltransferase
MAYHRKDSFYKLAKEAGYRSRAAYKLIELDQRLALLTRGATVLDIGCAPGGWLQVASQKVGPKGLVVGVDRLAVADLALGNVRVLQADLQDAASFEKMKALLKKSTDVVLSDMAPSTSGVGFADHTRSVELVRVAADVAFGTLRAGGSFCAKVFDGSEIEELLRHLKSRFGKIRRIHPKASRKESREFYLGCRNFR